MRLYILLGVAVAGCWRDREDDSNSDNARVDDGGGRSATVTEAGAGAVRAGA